MLTFLERRSLELLAADLEYVNFRGREWLRRLIIRGEDLAESEIARVSRIRACKDWEFTPGESKE